MPEIYRETARLNLDSLPEVKARKAAGALHSIRMRPMRRRLFQQEPGARNDRLWLIHRASHPTATSFVAVSCVGATSLYSCEAIP